MPCLESYLSEIRTKVMERISGRQLSGLSISSRVLQNSLPIIVKG